MCGGRRGLQHRLPVAGFEGERRVVPLQQPVGVLGSAVLYQPMRLHERPPSPNARNVVARKTAMPARSSVTLGYFLCPMVTGRDWPQRYNGITGWGPVRGHFSIRTSRVSINSTLSETNELNLPITTTLVLGLISLSLACSA